MAVSQSGSFSSLRDDFSGMLLHILAIILGGAQLERYGMRPVPYFRYMLPCKPGTEPQLAHLQRVFAQDYGCHRAPHAHAETVELVLVTQGEGIFYVDGGNVPVSKGKMVVYNSGIVHEERFQDEDHLSCFSCSISGLRMEGMRANTLIPDDVYPCFDTNDRFEEIRDIIEYMLLEYAHPLAHSARTAEYFLLALLSLVLDVIALPQADPPVQTRESLLCKHVKQYIDQHYCEELTLQCIADAVSISVSRLSHIFKEKIGYSPLQYVLSRRIGEAQTLLETTDLSVTDIGIKVGFSNPSYFNVMFNKKCHMTPLKYREIYYRNTVHCASLDTFKKRVTPKCKRFENPTANAAGFSNDLNEEYRNLI